MGAVAVSWGNMWRNVRRATNYVHRRRDDRGVRRIVRIDSHPAVTGSGREPPPARPFRQFLSLTVPGLALGAVGLVVTALYGNRDWRFSYVWTTLAFLSITVVCTARAVSATRAPRWIRATAIAAALIYPLALTLSRYGAWP